MGWKVNYESLSGSLASVFPFLKDRSNCSCCFTCTDTSYFVQIGFAFMLLWLHGISGLVHLQVLSPLVTVCISQGVVAFHLLPNLLYLQRLLLRGRGKVDVWDLAWIWLKWIWIRNFMVQRVGLTLWCYFSFCQPLPFLAGLKKLSSTSVVPWAWWDVKSAESFIVSSLNF